MIDVNPLVSVIIPTFNRAHIIGETLLSVQNQTYQNWECIVVDDGSDDDTKQIFDEFKNKSDEKFRFKYIYQKQSGAQVARNTGTSAARGDYIQYLDSDDLLYSNKLQEQVSFLISHQNCDGVFGDWQVGSIEKNEIIIAYKDEDLIAQLLIGRTIANFSFLMHKQIVQQIGDWDINIKRNQEIDFHLRGVMLGANFCYESNVCGLWRIHDSKRISSKNNVNDIFSFYRKWEKILQDNGLFSSELREKIAYSYLWHIESKRGYNNREMLALMNEAVRLNPRTLGYSYGRKIKIFKFCFGKENTLKLLLSKLKKKQSLKEAEI